MLVVCLRSQTSSSRKAQVDEEGASAMDATAPALLPAQSLADRERQDSANSLDRAARIASEWNRSHAKLFQGVLMAGCFIASKCKRGLSVMHCCSCCLVFAHLRRIAPWKAGRLSQP